MNPGESGFSPDVTRATRSSRYGSEHARASIQCRRTFRAVYRAAHLLAGRPYFAPGGGTAAGAWKARPPSGSAATTREQPHRGLELAAVQCGHDWSPVSGRGRGGVGPLTTYKNRRTDVPPGTEARRYISLHAAVRAVRDWKLRLTLVDHLRQKYDPFEGSVPVAETNNRVVVFGGHYANRSMWQQVAPHFSMELKFAQAQDPWERVERLNRAKIRDVLDCRQTHRTPESLLVPRP
jgi:hypothetical protein